MGLHLLHEGRARGQTVLALRQYQLEQVPVAVFEIRWRQLRAVCLFKVTAEALEVVPCQILAMGSDLLDMGKLPQADGGGDVGHVELAAQHIHVQPVKTGTGNALQTILFCQTGFLGIVQHQATALGRGDVLVRLEAERHEVTGCTDTFAIPAGTQGLGGVFDDTQVVLVGQCIQHRHIQGQAGQVDRDDRLGTWGDRCFYLGQVDVAGDRVDIGKYRRGAHFQNDVGGGDPRDRGGDDFVTRADPGDAQGNLHGAGAGVESPYRTAAKVFRQLCFERLYFWPAGDPA